MRSDAATRRGQPLRAYVFEQARHVAIAELETASEIVLALAAQQPVVRPVLEPPKANARLRRAIKASNAIADRV